jgi:hypothetical protein
MFPMAPLMLRGLEGHVDIGDSPQIQRNLVANRIRGLPTS